MNNIDPTAMYGLNGAQGANIYIPYSPQQPPPKQATNSETINNISSNHTREQLKNINLRDNGSIASLPQPSAFNSGLNAQHNMNNQNSLSNPSNQSNMNSLSNASNQSNMNSQNNPNNNIIYHNPLSPNTTLDTDTGMNTNMSINTDMDTDMGMNMGCTKNCGISEPIADYGDTDYPQQINMPADFQTNSTMVPIYQNSNIPEYVEPPSEADQETPIMSGSPQAPQLAQNTEQHAMPQLAQNTEQHAMPQLAQSTEQHAMPQLAQNAKQSAQMGTAPTVLPADSIQYMNGYLRTQMGKMAEVEFLVGNNNTSVKRGYLTHVGKNYIILKEFNSSRSIVCDYYNIKFVILYDNSENEYPRRL